MRCGREVRFAHSSERGDVFAAAAVSSSTLASRRELAKNLGKITAMRSREAEGGGGVQVRNNYGRTNPQMGSRPTIYARRAHPTLLYTLQDPKRGTEGYAHHRQPKRRRGGCRFKSHQSASHPLTKKTRRKRLWRKVQLEVQAH